MPTIQCTLVNTVSQTEPNNLYELTHVIVIITIYFLTGVKTEPQIQIFDAYSADYILPSVQYTYMAWVQLLVRKI